MQFFITGTDTDIGKSVIASWLCIHTSADYWKPIQTGSIQGTDSDYVRQLAHANIHPEAYVFKAPSSPHIAAEMENCHIDINYIHLPKINKLIVEGAGGVLVPINKSVLMIDLIKQLQLPVIVVARSGLGTINHTCLTLEALQMRNIKITGVIMNGELNANNQAAIEYYGNTKVLAEIPKLTTVNYTTLKQIPLSPILQNILL